MAWTDVKVDGTSTLTADEWNTHVTDQQTKQTAAQVTAALAAAEFNLATLPAPTTNGYTTIANAFDRDLTTAAHIDRDGGDINAWVVGLMFDLTTAHHVEISMQAKYTAANGTAAGSGAGFRIGLSNDNTNYFYCPDSKITAAGTVNINLVAQGLARYIRIEHYAYSTGGGGSNLDYDIYEIDTKLLDE